MLMQDGDIYLDFLSFKGNFSSDWQTAFPDLADVCDYSSDNKLLIKDKSLSQDYDRISDFLRRYSEPNLTFTNYAFWYKFRHDTSVIKLNRTAHYLAAVFILGSVARYEPELLLEVSTPGSELGWLLQRFLKMAERYFPQLKLMEVYNNEVYFSGLQI
jgi:YaaC-like Protein